MRDKTLSLFDEVKRSLQPESALANTLTCVYLFDFLDRLRLLHFPKDWFELLLSELQKLSRLPSFINNYFDIPKQNVADWQLQRDFPSLEAKTGNVYFQLWKDFSKEEYFQQTTTLLRQRLERNGIDISSFNNALDAGCGGGRYALALRKIGVRQVTAIDISPDSIQFARQMSLYPEEEVRFLTGSVLELPFENNQYDLVFSNGVLHHTVSTEKGVSELFRVLKPGGSCWLYLYGGKDSLFWDIVDFCRELLRDIPQGYVQHVMKVMGYPPGRIFHRADFWYVPINRRYFAHEVEDILETAGFRSMRRLKRGCDHDWDEIIFHTSHIDPYIYGEGEMRYWLQK